MTISETPSNAIRGFLPGYADESSPNYVPPEYRADYCTVALSPDLVEAMTQALWSHLEDQRNKQIWEALTAKQQRRLGPDSYRSWLKQHTRRDGTPRYYEDAVQQSSVAEAFPKQRALTFEQTRDVEHRVALRQAKGLVDGAIRKAEAQRRQAAQRKIYKTCIICKSFPVETESLANGDRACQPCTQVLEHVRAATSEVPAGGTRQEAVDTWLRASRDELRELDDHLHTNEATGEVSDKPRLLQRLGLTP